MNVLICVSGSHGDLRPMIALSKVFQAHGHSIKCLVSKGNQSFAASHGIDSMVCGQNWYSFLTDQLPKTKNVAKMASMLSDFLRQEVQCQFNQPDAVYHWADLIIGSGFQFAAKSMAEVMDIPYTHIFHVPQVAISKYHPPLSAMAFDLPHWANQLYWLAHHKAYNLFLKKTVNTQRVNKGLSPIKDIWTYLTEDLIVASHKCLAKMPIDVTTRQIQTGYPFLIDTQQMSPLIESFIEGHKPVLYIGFGSGPSLSKDKMAKLILRIVSELQVKVILQNGLSSIQPNDPYDDVLVVDYVSHEQLFPLLDGIVHHGGAGTTHTAALAGTPQLIIGFAMDQYYWGYHMHHLSTGPKPLSILNARESVILNRIDALIHTSAYKEGAQKVSNSMMSLNGGELTYQYIIRHIGK